MATPTGAGARTDDLLPNPTLRPATTTELHQALLDTATHAHRITIGGAGTARTWAQPVGPADATLDVTALSGVLQYNPADMTVAVRAGTPLESLQAEVGTHGQRVAFDSARVVRGATVGGLLATADGGPSRHTFGTLRDLVIGVTVVLGDGTVARSGGHVIKNVAGYDLAKLFSGSFGSLGVLAEVVLRLHPAPRASATVEVDLPRADAPAIAQVIAEAGIEPAAVELLAGDDPDDARLLLRFEGTPTGVDERAGAVPALTTRPARRLDEEAAARRWAEVDAVSTGEPGDTVARFGGLPSAAATTADRIAHTARELGVGLAGAATIAAGVHTTRLRGGGTDAHEQLLRQVHAASGPHSTVLRRDGLGPGAPLWGPAPQAVALMRAVRQRFDPTDRFGAGRLAAWLDAPAPGGTDTDRTPTDRILTDKEWPA